jgi:hypothetical protein
MREAEMKRIKDAVLLCALALATGCGQNLWDAPAELDPGAAGEDVADDADQAVSGSLLPQDIDRPTLNLVRQAIELGLGAGKGLVADGINYELARNGIETTYVGGESMVDVPDDAMTACPYVENAGNDGSTSVSCRLVAEDARDRAYVREADTLAGLVLGPEFDANRPLHEAWLRNGMASGIEGEFLMAVRRLREARVCDQQPEPVDSSAEQGIALGRQVFEQALAEQVAATPITQCDIDNGIIAPARQAAMARVAAALEQSPLCAGYEPTDMEDRAEFGEAVNAYEAGVGEGVDEGVVIGSEQLFRTWVCQVPDVGGGGGDGGGGGGGGDPLVLDLDGDGVRVSSPVRGVTFAIGERGARRTGWTADSDDGLLAIDHDGNGVIDSGRELLGDVSWTPDTLPERNGLLSLARYDAAALGGNGDGLIDARDAVFGALEVWRDRDLDGQTDQGELVSLADLAIESIALDYVVSGDRQISRFDRADGTSGAAVDVCVEYF